MIAKISVALVVVCCCVADVEAQRPTAFNLVFGLDPGAGKYDGVVGKPRDHWNLIDVGQTSLAGMRNVKGKPSNVRFGLSATDGEWGITGHSGVYHAYLYHNCRCVDLRATIDGLTPGRYKVYVFAHGDAPNQNAEIEMKVGREVYGRKATLNDGTWDFRSHKLEEGVQYVSFEVKVEGKETITITSKRDGSSYAMLNALQIVPVKKK